MAILHPFPLDNNPSVPDRNANDNETIFTSLSCIKLSLFWNHLLNMDMIMNGKEMYDINRM